MTMDSTPTVGLSRSEMSEEEILRILAELKTMFEGTKRRLAEVGLLR